MSTRKKPFVCPKCGFTDGVFHEVCPSCGRPFIRDYVDTRMHPRDPDLTGVVTSKFWVWVFLVLLLVGIGVDLFLSYRSVLGL